MYLLTLRTLHRFNICMKIGFIASKVTSSCEGYLKLGQIRCLCYAVCIELAMYLEVIVNQGLEFEI